MPKKIMKRLCSEKDTAEGCKNKLCDRAHSIKELIEQFGVKCELSKWLHRECQSSMCARGGDPDNEKSSVDMVFKRIVFDVDKEIDEWKPWVSCKCPDCGIENGFYFTETYYHSKTSYSNGTTEYHWKSEELQEEYMRKKGSSDVPFNRILKETL